VLCYLLRNASTASFLVAMCAGICLPRTTSGVEIMNSAKACNGLSDAGYNIKVKLLCRWNFCGFLFVCYRCALGFGWGVVK
jgi:hypothetical protein